MGTVCCFCLMCSELVVISDGGVMSVVGNGHWRGEDLGLLFV